MAANRHTYRSGYLKVAIGALVCVCGLITTLPAQAEWRKELGVFRVGLVAANDISSKLARVEPFRQALEEALGMDVELLPTRDVSTLIEAQKGGRVEYAIYSSIAYSIAYELCKCVEPLVVAKSFDQANSFHAVLISSADGPDKPKDIEPAKLGMLDPNTLGSTSYSIHALKLSGANLSPETGSRVLGSSDDLIKQLLSGQLETVLGWSSLQGDASTGYSRGTLHWLAKRNNGKATGYKIIWRSLPIPHGPHAVRNNLPSEAKGLLRKALLSMAMDDPQAYGAIEPENSGGFSEVSHEAFEPLVQYVSAKMKLPDPLKIEGAGQEELDQEGSFEKTEPAKEPE